MNKTFNIPKTFFGFLIASILFWLLINLSKEYTSISNLEIVYTDLPQKKILLSPPLKKLPVLIKGTGFNLISTKIANKPIKLSLKKLSKKSANDYYFLSKNIFQDIQDQLKSGTELTLIQKDSILLKIGTLYSKKVPLKANLNTTFQLGYDYSSPTTITPDSVLISGDKTFLKNINSLMLEKINLENISENKSIQSVILFPKEGEIKTNITSAKVNVYVDKFTEGEVEVPILVKNAPKSINIYPKKVKLIYKVSLNNFNKITPDLFKVECNYHQVENNDTNYLTPKLIVSSDLVSSVRVTPNKIDFLIHK
ncbi:CdaR family protein [Tenacibaculum aiptasiae]|uniref:CdaR family protein n=1 Tax=Tenacibaculum aiptasiae TaxID=426481 RepID=UPI0015881B59|nr:YbbR-like domain-containing protein [Tenacibaculum aiptasiae]